MTKAIGNQFAHLEKEYENLQKSLVDIDSSIKKVTGKDPSRLYEDGKGRNRFRNVNNNDNFRKFSATKRRLNEFRDVDDEIPSKKTLQSQVFSTSWEPKQRDQVLEEQKKDKSSFLRNKRMFGFLMKTLETFKNEESHRPELQKRAEIENKLDQADLQEREAVKKEREKLFKERKVKKLKLKCLEEKLQRAEIHKDWEKSQQFIGNFIETKSKPNIFYMPVKHNHETTKRLQETRDKYRLIFAEKRAKVQKELNDIEESYRKEMDDEDFDMESVVKQEADTITVKEEIVTPLKQNSNNPSKTKRSSIENGNDVKSSKTSSKCREESFKSSLDGDLKSDAKENIKKSFVKEELAENDKEFEPIYD